VPLMSELQSNFSLVSQLQFDWVELTGGELASSRHGCGTIVSGESLYFHKVTCVCLSVRRSFVCVLFTRWRF